MKLLALSIAALAFATSPVLAQNQPTTDTTQNTMQPSTTTTTHHVRRTTRTTHVHGTMHAGKHRAHHHGMRCACPSGHHHKGKTHHRTMKKTEKTSTSTQPQG